MTGENEIKNSVDSAGEENVAVEEVLQEEAIEEVKESEVEETITEEEFISEFAPEPVKIPNYNQEKELRKAEKAVTNERNRKAKRKKNSRKRRKLLRIVRTVRNVVLFVLLMVVTAAMLSSLLVKLNTTEYSLNTTIRSRNPEEFIVGKIKDPEKINLKLSSPNASVADVLRDNSMIVVSYADIKYAVAKSSYPEFIGKIAHNIISYYVHGKEYVEITEKDIAKKLMENSAGIKLITGRVLGQNACDEMARYISKSSAIKELSYENISSQKAAANIDAVSIVFSTTALICFVIAFMLIIVIIAISCKGFIHKMIGWAMISAGALVGLFGFLFKPQFKASSDFVKCVLDALKHGFMQSALICSAVALLAGVIVMLIGKALADDDDDEYEQDYIDEIEQIATAK